MANTALVASRRDTIAHRWLRGQSVASIAAETGTPLGTVKHDIFYIRQAMLDGQGDTLRLARAWVLAAAQDVIAEGWQRIARVDARKGWPDDRAVLGYLHIILRAQAQLARVAGIPTMPTFVQRQVLDTDLHAYADGPLAEEERARRWRQHARERAALEADDDEGDESDEDGTQDGYDEQSVIDQVNAAYEAGIEAGIEAGLHQAAEQVRADMQQWAAELQNGQNGATHDG